MGYYKVRAPQFQVIYEPHEIISYPPFINPNINQVLCQKTWSFRGPHLGALFFWAFFIGTVVNPLCHNAIMPSPIEVYGCSQLVDGMV